MDPLFLHSGTKLAEMIRSREVTSREVVEAHIGQIERVNPAINAVVATRFEEGLPPGVQVIGTHGNNHKTIAVALELERAFGGWVPPEQWS